MSTDPKNNELLDRAFISSLADGDIDEAVKLADRILTLDKNNRVARLVVGVRDLKQKKYPPAQHQYQPVDPRTDHGPGGDVAVGLGQHGVGDAKAAVAGIYKLTGPEWYPLFKDLHAGMILEISGKEKEAGVRFERAYKLDDTCCGWPTPMHAGSLATRTAQRRPPFTRPSTRSCRGIRWCWKDCAMPRPARSCRRWSNSAQAGAAEALYGIGATLTRRGGEDLALVYLQLALYLQPNHPLALLSLADLYESVKKPQMAIKVYERMPAGSPLKRNAQIQLATNLDSPTAARRRSRSSRV